MISIFKKIAHIFDNLDFHYVYNGKCIPFLLKIVVQRWEKETKYLKQFSIGISSSLLQVHSDFVEKLIKVTYKNREKYALIARVISGQILLPKKDQCYISESE